MMDIMGPLSHHNIRYMSVQKVRAAGGRGSYTSNVGECTEQPAVEKTSLLTLSRSACAMVASLLTLLPPSVTRMTVLLTCGLSPPPDVSTSVRAFSSASAVFVRPPRSKKTAAFRMSRVA